MSGLESRSCQRSQTAVQSGVKLDCPKQSTQLSQLCRWTLRPVRPKGQTMVRRNFRGAPRARPCTAPTTYARSHPHRPSQAIQLRVSSPRGRTWTGRTTAVWVSTLARLSKTPVRHHFPPFIPSRAPSSRSHNSSGRHPSSLPPSLPRATRQRRYAPEELVGPRHLCSSVPSRISRRVDSALISFYFCASARWEIGVSIYRRS